jgi:multisubunit Na+/H+ antiporter MnhG subunit
MIFGLIFWGQQTKTFPLDNLIALVFAFAFMLVITFAILIIIFGMAIHCIFNRDFSLGAKIPWSIFAFFTAPFGAAIYFFTVYRKQVAAHHEASNA